MLVFQRTIPIKRKDGHQVAVDDVGFGQTSCNVQAIQLVVVEFQPFLEIAQTPQSVVTGNISTFFIVGRPAELYVCQFGFKDGAERSDRTRTAVTRLYT
jgi:hypothetical protein